MKREFYLISIFLLLQIQSLSQDNRLRFVAGFPDYRMSPDPTNDEWDVVYNSAILKINKDSLNEEKILCDSMHILYFLRYHHNKNNISALLAEKDQKFGSITTGSFQLLTIDTRSMNTISFDLPSKVNVYSDEYDFFEHKINTLDYGNKLKYAIQYSNFNIPRTATKPRSLYYLFDPSTRELSISTPAHYQFVIPNGSSVNAYMDYNGDYLELQSDTARNLLQIPSALAVDSVYNTPLPKGLKLSKHGGSLVINDSMVRVMYFFEYLNNQAIVHLYNKKEEQWKKLVLKTDGLTKTPMKNFSGWIAGIKVKITTGVWNEDIKQPGQEAWKRERTKYSPSIYEILERYDRHWYSEGKLFIYNIDTEAIIEWRTGQSDSEILLVEDNKVYYRKYDEIYEAPIIKGKQLGKHRLLIKHRYVPAIHFMFKTLKK